MFSFRLYNKKEDKEFLFGVNNIYNSKQIDTINKALKVRNCVNELVPIYEKSKVMFRNINTLKYFLFDMCNFTLEDINELHKLGFMVEKAELSVFDSGLSNLYVSCYDEDIDSLEKTSLLNLFNSESDTEYLYVKHNYIPNESIKMYKQKYKYACTLFKNSE